MIRVQELVRFAVVFAVAAACRDEGAAPSHLPLTVPLPSAAPGAIGPGLPTARRAPPRIAVSTAPAARPRVDAGAASRGRGDGVPL